MKKTKVGYAGPLTADREIVVVGMTVYRLHAVGIDRFVIKSIKKPSRDEPWWFNGEPHGGPACDCYANHIAALADLLYRDRIADDWQNVEDATDGRPT